MLRPPVLLGALALFLMTSGAADDAPFDVKTPMTLNTWLRTRTFCPVGSSPGKSRSATFDPMTRTLAAACTSCSVKNWPYFMGQDLMRGQSTFVPSTEVLEFWLPAMICWRVLTPSVTH